MSEPRVPQRKKAPNWGDPYLNDQQKYGHQLCRVCGAIYTRGRWYLPEALPKEYYKAIQENLHPVVCPACRKAQDRVPGGILTLTGSFLATHREELLRLIHNESESARKINPLERVITIEEDGDTTVVHTTNEKLVQRLGHALHRAYGGKVQYRWSEDAKIARVYWHRD